MCVTMLQCHCPVCKQTVPGRTEYGSCSQVKWVGSEAGGGGHTCVLTYTPQRSAPVDTDLNAEGPVLGFCLWNSDSKFVWISLILICFRILFRVTRGLLSLSWLLLASRVTQMTGYVSWNMLQLEFVCVCVFFL